MRSEGGKEGRKKERKKEGRKEGMNGWRWIWKEMEVKGRKIRSSGEGKKEWKEREQDGQYKENINEKIKWKN